ncbi:MAG: hypothetical protein LBR91_01505 [Puniceicoccales bacterium]|nr:hypothetical protein [Puniceicoccales bacterium]
MNSNIHLGAAMLNDAEELANVTRGGACKKKDKKTINQAAFDLCISASKKFAEDTYEYAYSIAMAAIVAQRIGKDRKAVELCELAYAKFSELKIHEEAAIIAERVANSSKNRKVRQKLLKACAESCAALANATSNKTNKKEFLEAATKKFLEAGYKMEARCAAMAAELVSYI